jgi:hypothetical protein
MRARSVFVVALSIVTIAALGAPSDAWAKNGRLRRELTRLRGDIAQLSTQLNFMHRDLSAPSPGWGGNGGLCDDPCATDSDQDGIGDCEDYCPCDPNTADTDGDGIPDCADPCPDDATDACISPCGMDSDGDGTNDCEDACPWDPAPALDADGDGIADCQDPCPDDPANECWDPCRLDHDGDGVPDCDDVCPWVNGDASNGVVPECYPPPLPMPATTPQ